MLLTNHALTGAVIGLASGNPVVAAPLAFVSHFVLDSTPHFSLPWLDFKKRGGRIVGVLDCTGALIAYLSLLHFFPHQWLVITVGVFFACLPDLLYLPDIFFNYIPSKKLLRFHAKIQWSETPQGLITDAAWGSLMIYLLSRFN